MFDSMLTRSTAVGTLTACPHANRAPLMDWIAERRREKAQPAKCTAVRVIPFGGEQRCQSLVECVGFVSKASRGRDHWGGERGMFDLSNFLFICPLLQQLMLSVAR